LAELPAPHDFIDRYYPELRALGAGAPPVFVAPRIPTSARRTPRAPHQHADALWIDYGDERRSCICAPGRARRSRVRRAPGAASTMRRAPTTSRSWSTSPLAADAARNAGWRLACYGPQAELARLSGVRVDAGAVDEIVQQRALVWMLALAGVGAERDWRRGAIGFRGDPTAGAEPVRRYAERSLREFNRGARATFKLLLLRR
jgi:hypothetical protein